MWVCRDKKPWSSKNKNKYYSLYSERPSADECFIDGQWYDADSDMTPCRFKRMFGFTLRPGEGPVEVGVKRK